MWWLLAPATTSHLLLKFGYLCLVARFLLIELLLHLLHYLKHFLILLRPWGRRLIVNIHSICISLSCFLSQFMAISVSCRCRHLSFSWWHFAYWGRSVTTRHGSIIWFSLRGQVCERLPRQLFKLFDVRRSIFGGIRSDG